VTGQAPACIDHLVLLARDLATGVEWCERTLGVTPAAGGEHPLMGTHNRLLNVSSPAHPRAYLEIIAINPAGKKTIPDGDRRWFDMDDVALQQQVAEYGPQLIHWVASVPDVATSLAALASLGVDRGRAITASRPTPQGMLQWQITVRPDGQRLWDGCLPTLIEWGAVHPCDHLPASGVQLQSLQLQHPDARALRAACDAAGLRDVAMPTEGPLAQLHAQLLTPRGALALQSRALPPPPSPE